ncbi:hypothetical protein TL16_g04622 [Triparma laevis f. inornata]|uniref:Proline racemase n=2 Tax=Triparma laevis TaxID=1534972 RepID=A0A9W7FG29_9STRA|nr:hypothetical protein TL16_g04622 [Triparma laevis f. inornata]GMI11461.1 hypothetical protein TrLO_g5182 [Triparma laevis f. longispina]
MSLELTTIDCHCGGEPARIVTAGFPTITGDTMLEKRSYFMEYHDDLRKLLLLEPRGYPCQNADFVVEACDPTCAYGVIVAEQNKVYPGMSGHNCICTATALVESGMIPYQEPVLEFKLDFPAGPVHIKCTTQNKKVTSVQLTNVPSFLRPEDANLKITVPTLPTPVTCDVAWGGMFYCIVDASSIGLELKPENGSEICRIGEMIKVACKEQHPVNHPLFDYPGCDILVFKGEFNETEEGGEINNTVVMSNNVLIWSKPETHTAMLDRSPCGTGTSALLAHLHFHKKIKLNDKLTNTSIVSSKFIGEIVEDNVDVGGVQSIVTKIKGRAWITQYCRVVRDPSDLFQEGFKVGDIW